MGIKSIIYENKDGSEREFTYTGYLNKDYEDQEDDRDIDFVLKNLSDNWRGYHLRRARREPEYAKRLRFLKTKYVTLLDMEAIEGFIEHTDGDTVKCCEIVTSPYGDEIRVISDFGNKFYAKERYFLGEYNNNLITISGISSGGAGKSKLSFYSHGAEKSFDIVVDIPNEKNGDELVITAKKANKSKLGIVLGFKYLYKREVALDYNAFGQYFIELDIHDNEFKVNRVERLKKPLKMVKGLERHKGYWTVRSAVGNVDIKDR